MKPATSIAAAPDSRWQRARLVSLLLSAIVAVAVVPLALATVAALFTGDVAGLPFYLVFLLLPASLGVVGTVLTLRRPDNRIGWLLLVAGVFAGIAFSAGEYERFEIARAGFGAPLYVPAAWVASSWFIPAIGILVVFLPLLYPTGHLPSSRWRPVVIVGIFGVTMGAVGPATTPGPLGDPRGPLNPFVPPEPLLTILATATTVSNLVAPPVFLLALASVVVRFRRSRGVERQQLKWFLFAAAVTAITFATSIVAPPPIGDVAWALGLLAMAFLPVAIGLAILRYRLYDIDRVVSRVVGYTLVTAVLFAAFAAVIVVTQTVLAPLTQSNTLAVAGSTLVVAALFQPVRRVIQSRVDRRFDRSRVNAERVVHGFGGQLRESTDLDALRSSLVEALAETWGPRGVSLWVRDVTSPAATRRQR